MKPPRAATLCLECLGEENSDRVGSNYGGSLSCSACVLEKGHGLSVPAVAPVRTTTCIVCEENIATVMSRVSGRDTQNVLDPITWQSQLLSLCAEKGSWPERTSGRSCSDHDLYRVRRKGNGCPEL